jgi:hypothetical protein
MMGHTALTPAILSSFDNHPSSVSSFVVVLMASGSFGLSDVGEVMEVVLRGAVGAILRTGRLGVWEVEVVRG